VSGARGLATADTVLVSFDGGVRARARVQRPDRHRHLEAMGADEPRIARGGGYSYAAASFGADSRVLETRAFDRVLAFDATTGLLRCEAGATLAKVHSLVSPRGFCLPAQPGYPLITLGGCAAADVHGKNQAKDGNFAARVRGMRLFHPRHGPLDLRPGDEAFELTLGGFGLTGQVLSLEIELLRLPSRVVRLRRRRIGGAEETLALLDEEGARTPFLYTWQDFTAAGPGFGRGFLYAGDFADDAATKTPTDGGYRPITAATRGRPGPVFFNGLTTPLFNRAYSLVQSLGPAERTLPLFDFLFPVARKVAYFRLFGQRGFHEAQLLLPRAAFPAFLGELRSFLARRPTPITLASCKLFAGKGRYLRFDGDGLCLALDFPRGHEADALLGFLDAAVPAHHGKPNVMKDSRLPAAVVRASYPEYEAFREGLRRFDPARLYRSELSARLEL
jgi:decaprenylphospho-beta-D-ribofuranose 2-oxidase